METISYKIIKAKKEHNCNWCNEKILIGDKYVYSFLKDGYVYSWKNHIYCGKIAQELNMFDECSVTQEDFIENIKDEYMRIMSENYNDIYESKDFKYPIFKEQLNFVLSHYNIEFKNK